MEEGWEGITAGERGRPDLKVCGVGWPLLNDAAGHTERILVDRDDLRAAGARRMSAQDPKIPGQRSPMGHVSSRKCQHIAVAAGANAAAPT